MTEEQALQVADKIFLDVFGRKNPFTLEELERRYTTGVLLPQKERCAVSGKEVFLYHPQTHLKTLSFESFLDEAKQTDWMYPSRPINSIDDLMKAWDRVAYMTAGKELDSQDVTDSDSIIKSQGVYKSSLINGSKNILLSNGCFYCNFMIGSRDNTSCNFGLRIVDSEYCSSSFEVRWGGKVSRSFFIVDSFDLYECMFCYGLRSKKFCIANMQYEEQEYLRIKQMVIQWILDKYIGTIQP